MKKFLFLFVTLSLCTTCCFADSELLSKQATAFYCDNNYNKTIDLILQIKETERSSQDWLLLGNVFADNDKIEDAVFMYKKAIETDKKCYKAYYNLGNHYMSIGQYNEAVDNYTKAIKIKNDNPYMYYNLGCAYLKLNNLQKAKNNFNKSLMYSKNIPEVHYNLAYIYKLKNNNKLAETYLNNYKKLVSEY